MEGRKRGREGEDWEGDKRKGEKRWIKSRQ